MTPSWRVVGSRWMPCLRPCVLPSPDPRRRQRASPSGTGPGRDAGPAAVHPSGVRQGAEATQARPGTERLAVNQQPLEHRILLTATLCLLAFGAVMVYSASSATTLLQGRGNGSGYLVKFVVYGAVGLIVMRVLARDGVAKVQSITAPLLIASFVLVLAVHIPHVGVSVNGARRWIGPGPFQFQPSELMKLALVLYAATLWPGARSACTTCASWPIHCSGGRGLPARRHPAGPRHGDGDRPHDRRAADRGRDPVAQAGAPRRLGAGGRLPLRARSAVRAGAPDLVPGSLGACRGKRLSGRAGADRDRLGRAVRGRPRASRCRRSSTCPRPHRLHPRRDRRGAGRCWGCARCCSCTG